MKKNIITLLILIALAAILFTVLNKKKNSEIVFDDINSEMVIDGNMDTEEIESLEVSQEETTDMHSSASSLDYEGYYQGEIPCANCVGLYKTLAINSDKTFVSTELKMVSKNMADNYKNAKNLSEFKGTYAFDEDGFMVLTDTEGNKTFVKIQEGSVIFLGENKTEKKDVDKYTLEKFTAAE